MEWHLTEPESGSDTDELPVLSEEAILRFEDGPARATDTPDAESSGATDTPDAEPTRAADTPDAGPARTADTPDAGPARAAEAGPEDASDSLVSSVEALRSALEAVEDRWRALETRLKSHDPAARTEPGSEVRQAAEGRELLERIAALEAYIAGRSDRWREMEQEVEAKSFRIAELEAELAQRIVREQQLEERLRHEGGRSTALRDKLRQMRRGIEQASLADAGGLERTAELIGPMGELRSIGLAAAKPPSERENRDVPELVCLSSDMRERYRMNKDEITIGRAAECDIQIATDFVSRQHATIRREDAAIFIEDESSTNGVYVNAVRVSRRALADGDEITIGESRFRFVCSQQDLC